MNKVYVFGDLHGNARAFESLVEKYIETPHPTDSIICLGDVGLEYGNYVSGALRKKMSKFPGVIYIMRGNHDCRYWDKHVSEIENPTFDNPNPKNNWVIEHNLLINKKYSNIRYIRDEGGIYNIGGKNILFIPGAYSVDKEYRLLFNKPYEEKEQLTFSEQEHLLFIASFYKDEIDFVCSHTAPLCIQPYFKDLFLDCIDPSKVDSHMEFFLDEIYNIIGKKVKHWYFGHYHDDRDISTNFTMLYQKVVELGEKVNVR